MLSELSELKSKKRAKGSGGFGDVYILDDAEYAVKVIKKRVDSSSYSGDSDAIASSGSDEVSEDEFSSDEEGSSEEDIENEIDNLKYIHKKCPKHIIQYYGYYEDNENFYIATQPIKNGFDLTKMLEMRESALPMDRFKDLTEQLLTGMDCIHRGDMAHNDVKLENIMFNLDSRLFVYIDFGLSCKRENCLISGSTFYLSPEFIGVEEDFASLNEIQKKDLWGLGMCLLVIGLWSNPKMRRFEQSDTYNDLNFGIMAMRQRRSVEEVMREELPKAIGRVKKAYPKLSIRFHKKKISISELLHNLLQMNPSARKIY
jgi:serine/threonine protein kinase